MTTLLATVATSVGSVRETNQDRIVVGPWILGPDRRELAAHESPPNAAYAAVLDGMGGHAGGEIAAGIAAEVLASYGQSLCNEATVHDLLERANEAIYERMQRLPQLAGMGTTVVGLCAAGNEVLLFNVGDSRAYVIADGYLLQATTDDVAPSGALTQSLGGRATYEAVRVHTATEPAVGRRFLLATDGLFGHVKGDDLEQCIDDDDHRTVTSLLSCAIDLGGPDNVSIVLARVLADEPSEVKQ